MSTSTETVEVTMVDPGPEHLSFDEAIVAIQATLSEEHRKTFRHHSNAEALLEDLKSICDQNVNEQRKLLSCRKRFALFARTFSPYFDLLSVYMQDGLNWHGWLWGTVRLVFNAGSNYVLFLEKLANMFESLAHALPRYQQLHDLCKHRLHSQDQKWDDRFAAFMSYVYAEIIQFCLDVYRTLSRGSQGVALRHLRLTSPTILWRPLDSRFAHLEGRLLQHKKWLQSEIQCGPQDHVRIAQHRRDYLEFLHSQVDANKCSDMVEQRMAKRMRRVDKMKAWLSNCCSYKDIYEHRLRQRHPSSCTWFLNTEEYRDWRNAPFDQTSANDTDDLELNWPDRVLFVQAKPGFGKSFISGAVIDDLEAEAGDLGIHDDHEPPSTAYFHFNAAQSYCIHPNDAFRALAYQLIHTHRHDRSTLDAISLLMRKTPPHAKASSDDVLTVLSLLLRQHPTYIVIDGVDECIDIRLFLHSLPEVCRRSDTRVILFSRPDITIPLEYQKWASDAPHIVTLSEHSNKHDVESYVTENLHRMADQGFFGINMDRSLIQQIAPKSHGSFLWASLLLKYLQSSGLSPDERRIALEQAHQLEGLDSLYHHMLAVLNLRPQQEKQTIAIIFRLLALSINRLCIPAFQKALAVSPGQQTNDFSSVPNFAELISQMTCGLVELTECSVVFTHRSVKEYLQSSGFRDSEFSLFDENISHAHLAARCLSFLARDVPKRPLGALQPYIRPVPLSHVSSSGVSMRTSRSGDSGYKSMSSASDLEGFYVAASSSGFLSPVQEEPVPAFDADLPFLRYACLCWPIHLSRALSNSSSASESKAQRHSDPFKETPWLPSLSTFLTDRSAVTAWVEASWRYNLPPNLSRLVPLLDALKSKTPPATIEGREIRWVVHGVRELSEALNELKEEYGTTLREDPSLIWQWRGAGTAWRQIGNGRATASHARGHTPGGFWPVWDERVGRVHG